jgi:hypothetical protein
MSGYAKWGRAAGWGRTPSSLRRQAPPSFLHRHDFEIETVTYGSTRPLSGNDDSDFSSPSETEVWVEALLNEAEEAG